MNNEEKIERFHTIVNEMANLYAKKNRNYGNSFGELYEKLGPTSGLVPLHNKLNRLTALLTGTENNFESIEDTLKDLACYAVMNLIEYENERLKAMKEIEPIGDKTINLESINSDPCSKCHKKYESWQGIISPCSGCKYYNTKHDMYMTNTSTDISNCEFDWKLLKKETKNDKSED